MDKQFRNKCEQLSYSNSVLNAKPRTGDLKFEVNKELKGCKTKLFRYIVKNKLKKFQHEVQRCQQSLLQENGQHEDENKEQENSPKKN